MATSSVVTAADLALGDRLHLWGDMVWRLIGELRPPEHDQGRRREGAVADRATV